MLFKTLAWIPIPLPYLPRQIVALILFLAGLCIRYAAVGRLGRFFTTNVSIHNEHVLIIDGPYRWVRHPAYTGLLLALVAAGVALGDAIALLLLTVPSFLAFKFRIAIEEKLLNKKFGTAYRDYSNSTAKLLPWLF
jgi:protein-S-isoprenylcysteine O-methyltransferase Ste14